MEKNILYPFSINEDNSASYLKTLALAEKMTARVICFTVVGHEEKLDEAYLHLLNLNGYYQTMSNQWQEPKIVVKPAIKVGDKNLLLSEFLNEEQIDVLVQHNSLDAFKEVAWKQWINDNKKKLKILKI